MYLQIFVKGYESSENVAFVRHTHKEAGSFRVYCNRSGHRDSRAAAEPQSTKQKREKGTRKVGAVCPACISCTVDDDGYAVLWLSTVTLLTVCL